MASDGHSPLGPAAPAAEANAIVGDLALVLQALSQDPAINSNRIAVVGLSTGGRATLLASSEALMSRELDTFGPRFAAHAAFYPGCAALLAEGFAAPAGTTTIRLANFRTTPVPVASDHHLAEDAIGRLISFLRPVLRTSLEPR